MGGAAPDACAGVLEKIIKCLEDEEAALAEARRLGLQLAPSENSSGYKCVQWRKPWSFIAYKGSGSYLGSYASAARAALAAAQHFLATISGVEHPAPADDAAVCDMWRATSESAVAMSSLLSVLGSPLANGVSPTSYNLAPGEMGGSGGSAGSDWWRRLYAGLRSISSIACAIRKGTSFLALSGVFA